MSYYWNFSTNFIIVSLCILSYLSKSGYFTLLTALSSVQKGDYKINCASWHIVETNSKHIEKLEASRNQKPSSLQCHVCHSETSPGCFNLTEYGEDFEGFPQNCSDEQMLCMVKKFAFTSTDEGATTAPKTFAVKRNCTKRCEDGCVVMGERTRLYVCSQCCPTALCNVGSGVTSSQHISTKAFQRLPFYIIKLQVFSAILQLMMTQVGSILPL